MDTSLRELQRRATDGDTSERLKYLIAASRAIPAFRVRIDFAAWMGDTAALDATRNSQVIKHPFNLDRYGKRLSGYDQQVWRLWKHFCRTLGKEPAIAALIPCIDADPVWARLHAPTAKDELVGHYQHRLVDKTYVPNYQDVFYKKLAQLPAWPSWDFEYQRIWPGLNAPLLEKIRTLGGIIGCSGRYAAASAEILRSQVFLHAEPSVTEITQAIKTKCISWALETG